MEFSIDAVEFQKIIKMMGVVARANADDVTGRVFVYASGQRVSLMANNRITAIKCELHGVDVQKTGSEAMVYGDVYRFIMSFKPWDGEKGVKTFNVSSSKIEVENFYGDTISKSEFSFPAIQDIYGVSSLPDIEESSFIMNSTLFKKAVDKTLYAVDAKNINFSVQALKGLNMVFDSDSVYFAGSNGIVLSEFKMPNVTDYLNGGLILDYEFIAGLKRLVPNDTQMIWEIKNNMVIVKFENVLFLGKRIIGYEYPKYSNIFGNFKYRVNLNKEVILDCLAPVSNALDPDDNFRLTFEIKDKDVKLYNNTVSVEVPCELDGGIDFVIDLNGRYLIQSVEAIADKYILFKFSDSNGVFIMDSSTSENQKALITPIIRRG